MATLDDLKAFVDERLDDGDEKKALMETIQNAEDNGATIEDLDITGTVTYRVIGDDGDVRRKEEVSISEDLNTSGGD